MEICKDVKKALNSFELSELARIMEAIELHEYYACGFKNICGGYTNTKITDIDYAGDYDEILDDGIDLIEFAIISGTQDGTHSSCDRDDYTIPRRVVGHQKMTLKQKLKKIQEA